SCRYCCYLSPRFEPLKDIILPCIKSCPLLIVRCTFGVCKLEEVIAATAAGVSIGIGSYIYFGLSKVLVQYPLNTYILVAQTEKLVPYFCTFLLVFFAAFRL